MNTNVDSIYGQIIADLNAAQNLMPAEYVSAARARPNKFTASALLAKTYLYKQQWDSAAKYASNSA